MIDPQRKRALALGLTLVAATTVAHYSTPSSLPQVHHILDRLYYLPIILVGLRCGMLAGTGVGVLVALVYFPHIFTHFGGHPVGPENLGRTFELVMWVVIGFLTGFLSDRQREARRQAETARDEAEKNAQAARDAARDLVEAQEQILDLDRLAMMGLLSASLAHEVRNPLASLKGIADLLRKDLPADHPRRELVHILDEEVRRLDGVVGSFLDQARPSHEDGPASILDAAESLSALLAAESRMKRVRIEVSVTPRDLSLPMPLGHLRQALLNLGLNSLQAADSRGGVIRIAAWREGVRTVLSVSDTGPGFPEPVVRGATRLFFTTRDRGTGLGLPIVRGIVERHGGTLLLENPPEGGARAVMTFGGTP